MLSVKKIDDHNYTKINVYQVAKKNPDQLIDVRTSSVYSQIARVGRQPAKTKERAILVGALNSARKLQKVNGTVVITEPKYIPMKAKDVVICFGDKVERLRKNSQIRVCVLPTEESKIRVEEFI